jgi:hypothetical protein
VEESEVPGEKTTCLSQVIDNLYHNLYRVHLLTGFDLKTLALLYFGDLLTVQAPPSACIKQKQKTLSGSAESLG